jgi:hypothetical protein
MSKQELPQSVGSPAAPASAHDLARTALGIAEELGMAAVARDCRELLTFRAGR